MKRLFSAGILGALAALVIGAAPAAAQQFRIGYVNTQAVLAAAPGATQAQQTLQRESEQYRAQLDTLEQRLQTAQADLERQGGTLSDAARQQRQQQLQQEFASYQQRYNQLRQTAAQREQQLMEPIMKRISDTIEAVRREGNYGLILDSTSGVIIAADQSLDLTQTVIQRVQAAGPAAPAPTTPAPTTPRPR